MDRIPQRLSENPTPRSPTAFAVTGHHSLKRKSNIPLPRQRGMVSWPNTLRTDDIPHMIHTRNQRRCISPSANTSNLRFTASATDGTSLLQSLARPQTRERSCSAHMDLSCVQQKEFSMASRFMAQWQYVTKMPHKQTLHNSFRIFLTEDPGK